MDLPTIKQIIENAPTYFPIIALTYLLDKTNNPKYFYFLVLVTMFSLLYVSLIDTLTLRLNKDGKIGQIKAEKGRQAAMNHTLPKVAPIVKKNLLAFAILLLSRTTINLWSLYQLYLLPNLWLAKYLLVIGITGTILASARHFTDLFHHVPKILKNLRKQG